MKTSLKLFVLVAVAAPSVVLAQGSGAGVTTSPLAQPAPAMSVMMMLALSAVLAVVAIRLLRQAPKGSLGMLLLAVATTTAGVAFSTPTDVVVEGAECQTTFTHEYNPDFGPRDLVSNCAAPIRITSLGITCSGFGETIEGSSEDLGNCEEGLILANGDECSLPDCTS